MRKVLIGVLFLAVLVAACYFVVVRGIWKKAAANPSPAASARFQPGDVAIVMADNVDLRDGDTTVARLGKECRLTVQRVVPDWVGGTVQSGGKTLSGWVHEQYLSFPEAASPRGAAAQSATSATGTLGEKFARIVAAEREKKSSTPQRAEPSQDAAPPAPPARPQAATNEPASSEASLGARVIVAREPADLNDLQSLQLIERLVITGEQFSSASLQPLEGLRVVSLSIEAAGIGNGGLQHVRHVNNLRELRLWAPDINDAGLEFLARMTELESLDLEGTSVQGAGLVRLQELPRLSRVTLGPKTSDGELTSLQLLSHLTELDLRACYQLTQACLGPITEASTLRVLWLPRQLAETDDARIRQALPNCEVRR
jgi:hypothetical protein